MALVTVFESPIHVEKICVYPNFQRTVQSLSGQSGVAWRKPRTFSPGAFISTQVPKLEKSHLVSRESEAPTVMTQSRFAGLKSWASLLLFPVA